MNPERITGNETVDLLQGLQRLAFQISDPEAKIERIRNTVKLIGAGELLGVHFMVSTLMVLGQHPDASPDSRVLFTNGMTFVGELETYNYVLDEEIPLDALTMNFVEPEVLSAEGYEAKRLRMMKFQVPVLAIDTCLSMEAA